MKISSMQEYGLRCMLQLAAREKNEPVVVKEIAKEEGLTAIYVAKILANLKKAGLVKSFRGIHGGYLIARPAGTITVGETLKALGRVGIDKNLCQKFRGIHKECTHIHDCGIRPVWNVLAVIIGNFLDKLNLNQLLQTEKEVAKELATGYSSENLSLEPVLAGMAEKMKKDV